MGLHCNSFTMSSLQKHKVSDQILASKTHTCCHTSSMEGSQHISGVMCKSVYITLSISPPPAAAVTCCVATCKLIITYTVKIQVKVSWVGMPCNVVLQTSTSIFTAIKTSNLIIRLRQC